MFQWMFRFYSNWHHLTNHVTIFISANGLHLWFHYRGRGGWCGEHHVWLCGLGWTGHYTHRCRPLLLQHGQSLAMTGGRLTHLMAPRWTERWENNPKTRTVEKGVTVQLNTFLQKEQLLIFHVKMCWTTS